MTTIDSRVSVTAFQNIKLRHDFHTIRANVGDIPVGRTACCLPVNQCLRQRESVRLRQHVVLKHKPVLCLAVQKGAQGADVAEIAPDFAAIQRAAHVTQGRRPVIFRHC